eukprot:COSAG04_NODE_3897_length_2439_cov_10.823077_1_plen_118_part_10
MPSYCQGQACVGNKKQASCGDEGSTKRRWCATCAQAHGGVSIDSIRLRKSSKRSYLFDLMLLDSLRRRKILLDIRYMLYNTTTNLYPVPKGLLNCPPPPPPPNLGGLRTQKSAPRGGG